MQQSEILTSNTLKVSLKFFNKMRIVINLKGKIKKFIIITLHIVTLFVRVIILWSVETDD